MHTQAIPIAACLLVLVVVMALVWWWSIDGSGGWGCGGNGSFIGSAGGGSGSDSAGNASGTDSSVRIVACKASVVSNVTSHRTNFINQQGYALEISALTQTIIGGGTSNSDRTAKLSRASVDVS